MIAKRLLIAHLLVLLATSGIGLSANAQGEPERAAREEPERSENAAGGKGDAKLVARLEQIEAARRITRREAQKDAKAWVDGRAQRAKQHREALAELWGDVSGTIDGQARLRMHANRMARLNRLLDLAEQKADAKLVARVRTDIKKELARHALVMQAVRAGVP